MKRIFKYFTIAGLSGMLCLSLAINADAQRGGHGGGGGGFVLSSGGGGCKTTLVILTFSVAFGIKPLIKLTMVWNDIKNTNTTIPIIRALLVVLGFCFLRS